MDSSSALASDYVSASPLERLSLGGDAGPASTCRGPSRSSGRRPRRMKLRASRPGRNEEGLRRRPRRRATRWRTKPGGVKPSCACREGRVLPDAFPSRSARPSMVRDLPTTRLGHRREPPIVPRCKILRPRSSWADSAAVGAEAKRQPTGSRDAGHPALLSTRLDIRDPEIAPVARAVRDRGRCRARPRCIADRDPSSPSRPGTGSFPETIRVVSANAPRHCRPRRRIHAMLHDAVRARSRPRHLTLVTRT